MYEFTSHALRRMKERSINKDDIDNCLLNYNMTFEEKEGYTLYIADHSSGRRIQVVVDNNVTPHMIVTALWLE